MHNMYVYVIWMYHVYLHFCYHVGIEGRFTTKFTNGVRKPRFVNNLQCRTKAVRSVVRLFTSISE